ncbi:unnamed protein product [Paramecium primaurelia]|uniref:RING-type E3 ubiquitin transferase n=1 Tax=Paramecium primaurelia TaxID=5886 RepID=A0A8S1Q1B0_PARPR|nr:unnamed protein product [Paramecium primaurelia]
MFNKRKIQKKDDVLNGIQVNEQEEIKEPQIQKKNKIEQTDKQIILPLLEETKYKAGFVLQNQNNFAVEKIAPESKPYQNEIAETLQRLKSIHSIDDVKKGQVLPPKKNNSLNAPIAMPSNVKFSCTYDFNPMLCKDYHDTGYCTFGDSCIYIHDRGDYKSGWEQEKEYQEQLKTRRMGKQEKEDLEFKQKLEEYSFPETCSICQQQLNKPVQTKCNHFFCEKCVITQKKCPECGKPTDGIFHSGVKIIQELKNKRDKFIAEYKQQETKKQQRLSECDWMI